VTEAAADVATDSAVVAALGTAADVVGGAVAAAGAVGDAAADMGWLALLLIFAEQQQEQQ